MHRHFTCSFIKYLCCVFANKFPTMSKQLKVTCVNKQRYLDVNRRRNNFIGTHYDSLKNTVIIYIFLPYNIFNLLRYLLKTYYRFYTCIKKQVSDQSEIIPVQYFAPNATVRIVPMDSEPISLIQHNSGKRL